MTKFKEFCIYYHFRWSRCFPGKTNKYREAGIKFGKFCDAQSKPANRNWFEIFLETLKIYPTNVLLRRMFQTKNLPKVFLRHCFFGNEFLPSNERPSQNSSFYDNRNRNNHFFKNCCRSVTPKIVELPLQIAQTWTRTQDLPPFLHKIHSKTLENTY